MCYLISDRPFYITFRTTWLSDLRNLGAEEGDFATDEVEDFLTFAGGCGEGSQSFPMSHVFHVISPHTLQGAGCKTRIQPVNQGDFASWLLFRN